MNACHEAAVLLNTVRRRGELTACRNRGLTAVVIRSSVCWDIRLCIMWEDNRRFGGTYLLHLQGISCCLIHSDSLLSLPFGHEDEGDIFLETSMLSQRTTRRYIPEDKTLFLIVWVQENSTEETVVICCYRQYWSGTICRYWLWTFFSVIYRCFFTEHRKFRHQYNSSLLTL
jgi:hypothetical protein